MSHVENLKVGQWIVVTNDHSHESLIERIKDHPWLLLQAPKIRYLGIPCKVVAINQPYILVQTGDSRSVIDSRTTSWTKAGRRYVNEFLKMDYPSESTIETQPEQQGNNPRCLRCGNGMRVKSVDGVPVSLVCENCGGEFI